MNASYELTSFSNIMTWELEKLNLRSSHRVRFNNSTRAGIKTFQCHRLQLRDLLAQPVNLQLLGLHMPKAGERMRGISTKLLDPSPQHVVVDLKNHGPLGQLKRPAP